MKARRRSYAAYSTGGALAWTVILVIATRTDDEKKHRPARLTCAGWWLGLISATIARHIYPPPRRWRAPM
jgi:hypothetical protein